MQYIPILTYHRVLEGFPDKVRDPHRIAVSVDQFRKQLQLLKWLGYRTIGMDEFSAILNGDKPHPGKAVALTFDDGYEEMLTRVQPLLAEFGATATVYIVSDLLGKTNEWDNGSEKLLTVDQLRTLQRSGWTIGAHTCTHPHLPQISLERVQSEITQNKRDLESCLQMPIKTFAYPYGETNDSIDSQARLAGFELAVATDRASCKQDENRFRIRRVTIFPSTSLVQFWMKLQPWYPRYKDWKQSRRR